jgi:hypothetical protein
LNRIYLRQQLAQFAERELHAGCKVGRGTRGRTAVDRVPQFRFGAGGIACLQQDIGEQQVRGDMVRFGLQRVAQLDDRGVIVVGSQPLIGPRYTCIGVEKQIASGAARDERQQGDPDRHNH